MRLTNTMRDAFVRQVMDDVPSIDYTEQIRKLTFDAVFDVLPPLIQKAWKDPKLQHHVYTTTIYSGDCTVIVPGRWSDSWRSGKLENIPGILGGRLEAIKQLQEKLVEQNKQRINLTERLRQAAYSCSTVKTLKEMLPEFAKYLPPDEPAAMRTLPVVTNLVADFAKAGWPKGKKAQKLEVAA